MQSGRARFSRQLVLPEVGAAGQQKLARSAVLVVGCGGLGAPVVQYLAAAGVGRLTLMDDDVVDESNLNRQVIHRAADVGRRKAERAAEWVRELDADIEVHALAERFAVHNGPALARTHNVVVDCTDGLPIKYFLNDVCVRERVHLVHGAATAFSAQVLVVRAGGRPCLRCLFEEIPPAEWVATCQSGGILGAVCGLTGTIMTTETIKLLLDIGGQTAPTGKLLTIDCITPEVSVLPVEARATCRACGSGPSIDLHDPTEYIARCDRPGQTNAGDP